MFARSVACATVVLLSSTALAGAAPTPLPGGANQVKAQSGVLGQTVWNGAVRLTLSEFRDATPDETAAVVPSAGRKVVVFVMKIRNGQHDPFIDLIEYTLADKDDVAVSVPTMAYTHANLNILQGAAQVQKAEVTVDQDFVPVKLIAQCVTCGSHSQFKTVRFSLPAPAAQ